MKKNLLKFIAVLCFGLFLNGQNVSAQAFKDGTNVIQVGIGFPNLLAESSSAYSLFGTVSTSTTPPIHIGFEHGITDNISVGGYFGYTAQKISWDYTNTNPVVTQTISNSWIILGARGNYHFATSESFDPYAGVFLGYFIASSSITSTDPNYGFGTTISGAASTVGFGAQIGFNYYFSDSFGAHVELGYGLAIFNVGLSLKF